MVVFALTVLPLVLKNPIKQSSVYLAGAVKTNMAVSFEISVSYGFEMIFGLAQLLWNKVLAMATLACILMMAALHHARVKEEVAQQQKTTFASLKRHLTESHSLDRDAAETWKIAGLPQKPEESVASSRSSRPEKPEKPEETDSFDRPVEPYELV